MRIEEQYRQYMYSYPHKTAYRPVSRGVVEAHLPALLQGAPELYIHLPFCHSKCGYCNLFSVAGADRALIDQYLRAVFRQLKQLEGAISLRGVRFSSLVLGGGTPALLDIPQLWSLLDVVERVTGASPEHTPAAIELSPTSATTEKVAFLRQAGFCRVSLGVQSFLPEELAALGRREDPLAAKAALERLSGRFAVCNVDLIYGIPGQTGASLLQSLRTALDFAPDELFLYPLYTRRGTPMEGCRPQAEQLALLYAIGRDVLLAHGYRQLSMRRFARGGKPSQTDCGMETCLSLGCGGRSYLGDLHVCEPYTVHPAHCRSSLLRFLEKQDFLDGLTGYLLDRGEHRRRYLIKNLLHAGGVCEAAYRRRFAGLPEEDFTLLGELVREGFAQRTGNTVALTEKGLAWSDGIGPLFISQPVQQRSDAFSYLH